MPRRRQARGEQRDATTDRGRDRRVVGDRRGDSSATGTTRVPCILVARRREVLEAVATEIDAEVEICDISEKDEIAATTARILDRHPAIHVLVNSAGILARGTFVDAPLELVERASRSTTSAGSG